MLQEEHSAILSTFIKLPFVIKIFVLYTFEWPFTQVYCNIYDENCRRRCGIVIAGLNIDWLQSLKQFFINVSYHILEGS